MKLKGLYFKILLMNIMLFFLIAAIIAIPVMFLWNLLIPAICGFKIITYIQAIGLVILFGLMTNWSNSSVPSK